MNSHGAGVGIEANVYFEVQATTPKAASSNMQVITDQEAEPLKF